MPQKKLSTDPELTREMKNGLADFKFAPGTKLYMSTGHVPSITPGQSLWRRIKQKDTMAIADKNNPALEAMYTDGYHSLNDLLRDHHLNERYITEALERRALLDTDIRNKRLALSRIETLLPEGTPDIPEWK